MGMVWKFKKIIPLSVALILGSGIIFVAAQKNYFPGNTSKTFTDMEDGSWEDALSIISQETSSPLRIARQDSIKGSTTQVLLPATATEALAREFLLDYVTTARVKGGVVISDEEARATALRLMQKTKISQGKQYHASDLRISPDNSPLEIDIYATNIKKAMVIFAESATKSDIEIVYMSPNERGKERQTEYDRTSARYAKLVKDLLATKTPSRMASLHLRLVQGYANMQHNLTAMMSVFADPIKGLAALGEYRAEVSNLIALAKEYEAYLTQRT
jgi:hypothetical protein